jgi:hypothetical protein
MNNIINLDFNEDEFFNNVYSDFSDYEYEKYIATPNNVKEIIEKYGVAIVPNVLNDDECEEMINEMWNYLEHISQEWVEPIKRDNITTYRKIYNLFLQGQIINFIIKFWCIGHCQMAWNVRQNPKIVNIFAKFWNVKPEELLVSFDSSAIHMPPEITGKWTTPNYWYHTDQSYESNNFKYLQSWVTAFDVNEGDATLAFLESSHKIRGEFISEFYNNQRDNDKKQDNDDYKMINYNELEYFKSKGCFEKKIKCPKGSLVLWDSRTVHCGIEPYQCREKQNFRCVSYLCYAPRNFALDEDIILKQHAFNEMYTTTHNPININLVPKTPYINFNEEDFINVIDKPKLTELGLKLAGF